MQARGPEEKGKNALSAWGASSAVFAGSQRSGSHSSARGQKSGLRCVE
jgi:hypothetical protein